MHTAGVAHEPQPVVAVTRATMRHVSIVPVDGLPEIVAGDDLAGLIAAFSATTPQDVVVISQKVVSKAEGAVVRLDDIIPSRRARRLARKFEKDARAVEVVLRQSTEVLRAERGVLITRTTHGFVCANSCVDASNTATGELVLFLKIPTRAPAVCGAACPAVRRSSSLTPSAGHGVRASATSPLGSPG